MSPGEPIVFFRLSLVSRCATCLHRRSGLKRGYKKGSKLPSIYLVGECCGLLFVTRLRPSLMSPGPLVPLALLATALVVPDDFSPEPGRLDDLDHNEGVEDEDGEVGDQLSQNQLKSGIQVKYSR